MSSRSGTLEQFAGPLRPSLEALVRSLDRDPARSKRLIRQLLDEDRDVFLRGAIPVLKSELQSPGAHYLVEVVISAGLLLPALCDPQLTREQALALAQTASRVDPKTEMVLARCLSDGVSDSADCSYEDHTRLMEILTAISDGARVFPCLVRLLRHPNPHIRSKAVLMIGRGSKSATWVRQRLTDSDPRIRANAAEALWGVESDEARGLMESLVHDSNNRVAGNAIVGLYRLGDGSAIPEILNMARHESPMFRATAAWAMGVTGDPRFTETLAGLLREQHTVVRKRAFAALGCIRTAVAQARQGRQWRLFARMLEGDAGRSGRRLAFGMARDDGSPPPALNPTQVLLNEDGQNVVEYRLIHKPLPETMSVLFVLPRSGAAVIRECLPWKRSTDLWGFLFYSLEPSKSEGPPAASPRLHASPEAITAELDRVPAATECGDLWRTLARAVKLEAGRIPGKRQVIVWNQPATRAAAPEELESAAAANAAVQVLSPAPDAALVEFCRRANGLYRETDEGGVLEAYLNLLARYEVAYQPLNPEAQLLKLRLHGEKLWSETVLPLR